MTSLILKFGGAAMASVEQIRRMAALIAQKKERVDRLVVVVSAMGSTTDELLLLARQIHPNPPKREQDMLISVGERVSMTLLAMALDALGVEAISFTGSQSGIITTDEHENAEIIEVRPQRIFHALEDGKVVIVAGFQGVSRNKEVTTLGRNGSDTSAVALAAALGAPKVEFYKDVAGIGREDPNENPETEMYAEMTFEQVKGEVLDPRSLALAEEKGITLQVRPYNDFGAGGTVIHAD